MAAPLPLTIIFSVLLSSVSLQVSARLEPLFLNANTNNYHEVGSILANPYQGFIVPETFLITGRADDAGSQKEMSPEQRKRLKERRERFESLSPSEKKRLKEARKKFKQLPPEERKRLKQKWKDLSPEERNKVIRKKGQIKA